MECNLPDTTISRPSGQRNPNRAGDTTISGTGTPGSTVTVTLPDGTPVDTTVKDDGTWSVDVPPVKSGDTIAVSQTTPGMSPSSTAQVTVLPKDVSAKPTVNPVKDGDKAISGTGVPGATIQVTLPDGTKVTTTVGNDGKWVVATPPLKSGQTITVVQVEAGKAPSAAVTLKVSAEELPSTGLGENSWMLILGGLLITTAWLGLRRRAKA